MPMTAFSKAYGKELDVEQLLRLMSGDHNAVVDTTLTGLAPASRDQIRADVECPSCFATGAVLVAAGKSKTTGRLVRQACFRFKDGEGGNGHHPFCDFFREDEDVGMQPENLVAFGSPRSDVTKAIRELVCRGVQIKVIDQRRMRDMRQWFFERKQRAQFEVRVNPQAIEWAHDLYRYVRQSPIAFHPSYADIPGFDWEGAARARLWHAHKETMDAIWQARVPIHIAPFRKRAVSLASRYQGQTTFDPSVLQDEYRAAQQLCNFACDNYAPLKTLLSRIFHSETRLAPPALLALCALLLHVSDWKLDTALDKLVAITREATINNQDDGNFIGLNPFHDFGPWEIIRQIQGLVTPLKPNSYDAQQQYKETQEQLHHEYAAWRQLLAGEVPKDGALLRGHRDDDENG